MKKHARVQVLLGPRQIGTTSIFVLLQTSTFLHGSKQGTMMRGRLRSQILGILTLSPQKTQILGWYKKIPPHQLESLFYRAITEAY